MAAPAAPDPVLNAVVSHREDLTERLAIVRVEPAGWTLPQFEPGQWATLGLPDPEGEGRFLKRVYSIASEPGRPHLEFYIQLVKEGEFTTRLWHLHPGDRLWVAPNIAGFFTLEPVPAGADLALVATGTGLAPFVSMLRHARRTGSRRWRRCVVVHGARNVSELGYRDELTAHAAGDSRLTYLPLVTREPEGSGWTGRRGRVQSLLEEDAWVRAIGAPLDTASWHVFLCGNPEMIDDVDARLKALGFTHHRRTQPGNLHFERYW
jgi:ferredoxin--NADP+ reductase